MSLLRTFIAIEIPPEIQSAIQTHSAGLRAATGNAAVRWVAPGNVHLTLKFLGDVSPANVQLVAQMLATESAGQAPFWCEISGLGAYPQPRRPRVLWIGVQAPPALETLQRAVEAGAARLGYALEERPFSAHLTIGRVSQHASTADLQRLRAALEAARVGPLGRVHVEAVHLFRSDLQPSGAVYTRLFSAPLQSPS